MRKLVSCFLLVASVGIAVSADNSAARKALDQASDKFITALKHKDLGYLKSSVTPDFKAITKKKTYNRDEWVSMTGQLLKAVKITSISRSVLNFNLKGNTAVLKTKTSLVGTITVPGAPASQKLNDVSVDNETWVKTSGGWKFKTDETITENATLNGKKIPGA